MLNAMGMIPRRPAGQEGLNKKMITPIPRVTRSPDGYLFLTGGANQALQLFDSNLFQKEVPWREWQSLLAKRREFFEKHNIKWRMLLCPEKISVYGQKVITELVGPHNKSPGDSFISLVGSKNIVYPKNFLINQAANYDVYMRTDSHWSSIGALCAFQTLASDINLEINYGQYHQLPLLEVVYHGDLWSTDFADMAQESFGRKQVPEAIRTIYKNRVVGVKERTNREDDPQLHVGSHVIFYNKHATKKEKVFLFGSSFSEYRLHVSLLTFVFTLFFEEVHFIWSTSIDFDYIERNKPDIVITEIPERFLRYCPDDNLCIEDFGSQVVAEWLKINGQIPS